MSLSPVVSARDEEQKSPLVSTRDEEVLSAQEDPSAVQSQKKSVRSKDRLSGKAKSFDSWSGIEIAQTPRLVDAEDDAEDFQV